MHPSRERRRYASVPINASPLPPSTPFSNDTNKFDRSPSYFLPNPSPPFQSIQPGRSYRISSNERDGRRRSRRRRRRRAVVPPPRENYTRLPGDNRLVFVSTNVISRVHEVVRAARFYLESASRPPPSPPHLSFLLRLDPSPFIFPANLLSRVEKLSPRATHSLERRLKKKRMDRFWSSGEWLKVEQSNVFLVKNLVRMRRI